jgi:hypothetical protein
VYFDDLVDLASSFIYSYSKYVILLKIGAMIKYKEKMAKWINVLKNNLYYIILHF